MINQQSRRAPVVFRFASVVLLIAALAGGWW